MIFHVANAWQESKDVVKLFACCFEDVRDTPTLSNHHTPPSSTL